MTVFITGSTGFIGSVVAATLHRHGYDVLALARSHASASRLKTKGYRVLRGDLTDTAILADGARQADGVIHLGLRNEGDIAGTDAADVRAMLAAIAGTTKSSTPAASGYSVLQRAHRQMKELLWLPFR